MKKGLFSIIAISLAFAASGCKSETVSTPDGLLPPRYVPIASSFLGNYSAHGNFPFGVHRGEVRLNLDGRRLVLSSTMDLLDAGCHSRIGSLEAIQIETDDSGKVSGLDADFAFDPGECLVAGRDVVFHWNRTLIGGWNVFEVSIPIEPPQTTSHGPQGGQTRDWILKRMN